MVSVCFYHFTVRTDLSEVSMPVNMSKGAC